MTIELKNSYVYIIRHVFAWCPIAKLSLQCIIEASLGSDGRPRASPLASHHCLREASIIHIHTQFSNTMPRKHMSNILYCTGSPSNYALHYVSHIMAVFWYECHSRCSILFCPTKLWFSLVKLTH